MNIKEAKEEIKRAFKAYNLSSGHVGHLSRAHQRPILLIGPPGIGKTAIMEQIAMECGIGFLAYTMTHHTRQSAIGLPYIEKVCYDGQYHSITRYTMSEIVSSIYDYMEKTGKKKGILFIDEINCVSETLMPIMLQFLQNKTFGNHPIPEGWVIVAAGNPPEYNQSARELDTVTLDRVKLMEIQADFSVWKEYAVSQNIHPAIQSYLSVHPGHFYLVRQEGMEKQFVTARGWEDLSCILIAYEATQSEVTPSLFFQYLRDEEVAGSFSSFYRMFTKCFRSFDLDRFLDGGASEAEEDALFSLLSHSSTDIELGLAALLSGILLNRLSSFCWKKESLTSLKALFTKAIAQLMKAPSPSVFILYDFISNQQKILKVQNENALLSASEEYIQYDTISLFQIALLHLPDRPLSPFEIRDGIRAFYDSQLLSHQKNASSLLDAIDRSYRLFAKFQKEDAILYLTADLSKKKEAVTFLSEYNCPLYEAYSGKLLFTEREQKLRKEIESSLPL